MEGVEPPRREALVSKTSVAAVTPHGHIKPCKEKVYLFLTKNWSGQEDLNLRLPASKAGTLARLSYTLTLPILHRMIACHAHLGTWTPVPDPPPRIGKLIDGAKALSVVGLTRYAPGQPHATHPRQNQNLRPLGRQLFPARGDSTQ